MAQRMNVSISDDMREWLETESKRLSIPMSSLIIMALNAYITQQKTVQMVELANRKQNTTDIKAVLTREFLKIGYDLSWDGDTPIIK